jgi:hypothetical protein
VVAPDPASDASGGRDSDRPDGPGGPGAPTVPKLTLPQRLLTLLPQLRRDPTPAIDRAPAPARPPQSRPAARRPAPPKPLHPDRPAAPRTPPPAAADSDLDADDADAVETEADDGAEGGAAPGTRSGRRGGLLTPAGGANRGVDPAQDLSPAELVQLIKRIDDRERLYALLSVPFAVILTVILVAEAVHTHPHQLSGTILFEGIAPIVFAAILLFAVRTRKRSFVAFMLVFMGLPLLPPGLIFSGLGLWMILRSYKWQRILQTKGGDPSRPSAASSRSGRASGRASSPKGAAARGSAAAMERRRRKREAAVKGPPPNKRYTPPKPPRPRPPKPTD